jgi:hypothetical protein
MRLVQWLFFNHERVFRMALETIKEHDIAVLVLLIEK